MAFLIGAYAAAILGAGSALCVVIVLELWPRPARQTTAPPREPAAVISMAEARRRLRRA